MNDKSKLALEAYEVLEAMLLECDEAWVDDGCTFLNEAIHEQFLTCQSLRLEALKGD